MGLPPLSINGRRRRVMPKTLSVLDLSAARGTFEATNRD
jgi:hypothetical protein